MPTLSRSRSSPRGVNMRSVLTLFVCYIVETKSHQCVPLENSRLSILNEEEGFIDVNRELGFLGISGLEEPKNLKECKEALKVIARNYLEFGIHENELLQAVKPGKKIDEIKSFPQCENIIISLVRYLYGIQRTMKFGNLRSIPCKIISWYHAKAYFESFCLPHCPNGTNRDYLIGVLNNESLTTVNDFINAFYNASSICGYLKRNEINYWLSTPAIRLRGDVTTDEKLILFLLKELRNAHLDIKVQVAKYNYWSLLEARQEKWSPSWLSALDPLSIRTIWRIILRQRSNRELKIFFRRLISCSVENVNPEKILDIVLNKYATETKNTIYAEDFPKFETDEEWRALTKEMNLNSEDRCILKSLAQSFPQEEIISVTTEISDDEDTYLHIINVPYGIKEYVLEGELKAFLNDKNIVILYVIKLIYKTGWDRGEAVVEFKDQKSRDAAWTKIEDGNFVINNRTVESRKLRNYC